MGITKTAQILKIVLNGIILHALLCVVDFYTVKYSGNLYLLEGFFVSLAVAAAGEFAAKKIKHNFVSFLLSLLISAFAACMMFVSVLPGMNAVFAVVVFIWLMLYRHNKVISNIPFAHKSFILLFIFMFLVGIGFDIEKMNWLSSVEGIAFLIINMFLDGVFAHEKFILENRSVQNFPQEQIRKTYSSLLAVFVSGCLAVVVLVSCISLPVSAVTDAVSKALHEFYEALPKYNEAPSVAKEGRIESAQYEQALIDFGIEGKQNEVLETVGTVVSVILTVVCILLILAYFIHRIVQSLKQTKLVGTDKLEFAYANDTYAKVKKEKYVFKNEGNGKKIRKLYKKYILKATKKNVRKSETPGMLQSRIAGDEEKTETIRRIYEKARYSNEECSEEDTQQFKKNLK